MSLEAFDPHNEWMRKRSHLADVAPGDKQTEVALLLKREGKKIVSASVHKTGPVQDILKHRNLSREHVKIDYKEEERRQEEDQRKRAQVAKIGDVFKRALQTAKDKTEPASSDEKDPDTVMKFQLDSQTDTVSRTNEENLRACATQAEEPADATKSPTSHAQDDGSPRPKPSSFNAAYTLLTKSPASPVAPFTSESPWARSPRRGQGHSPRTSKASSPRPLLHRRSPGPLQGMRGKAKFLGAAKKVGAVVGIVQNFSEEKKEEKRKRKEQDHHQAVLLSLNREPLPPKSFLMKDKVRSKVVKAVRKAAVLSSVDKGALSTLFGTEAVSRASGMVGDAESVLLAEGGTISLKAFFRDNQEELQSMIRKFKFFRTFNTEQSLQVADIAQLKIARSGEILFKQDAEPDAAYIVLSGRVSLYKSKQGEQKQTPFLVATQGDSVGDRNQLDERCNRNFTAQVDGTHAELMMFPRDDLDACVQRWRREAEMKKINLLLRFPMFTGMPLNIVQRLALVLDKAVFKKGHVIYKQQDDASAMYFIWEGTVQMLKRVEMVKVRPGREENFDEPPQKLSKSLEVALLSGSEFFGELEVFNDLTRNSSAIAQTPCTTLVLRRQDLQENVPPPVLDSLWRYSLHRVHWRNTRTQTILDTLQSIHWIPERDPRQLLDPEPKALAKMKGAAILPALTGQGTCMEPAKGAWLGAHTSTANTEAREWAMYHSGPWSTKNDPDRPKEDKGASGANALDMAVEQESFFSHSDTWSV